MSDKTALEFEHWWECYYDSHGLQGSSQFKTIEGACRDAWIAAASKAAGQLRERFDYRGFATKALHVPAWEHHWIQAHYDASLDHVTEVMREVVEAVVEATAAPQNQPADDMTYTETLARELALRVLGRSSVPISSYDSEAKARELVDLLSGSIAMTESAPECICAQGVTKCPRHGTQPAKRGPCPRCGAVLGYCAAGEYCTKEDCKYVA